MSMLLGLVLGGMGGGGGSKQDQSNTAGSGTDISKGTVNVSQASTDSANAANSASTSNSQAIADQMQQQGAASVQQETAAAPPQQMAAAVAPDPVVTPQADKSASQGSDDDIALAKNISKMQQWGFSQQPTGENGAQEVHFDPMQFAGHLAGGDKFGALYSNIGKALGIPTHNVTQLQATQVQPQQVSSGLTDNAPTGGVED